MNEPLHPMISSRHLALCGALALVCGTVVSSPAPTALRVVAGIPLVLLLPGYALTAALFADLVLDPAAALLFSIAGSVAVAVLGTLLVNVLPVDLGTLAWAWLLVGVTLAAGSWALARIRSGPGAPPLPLASPSPLQAVMLVAALALTAGALLVARHPLPASGVSGYTALSIAPQPGSRRTVVVHVRSSELRTTSYRLVVAAGSQSVERRLTLRPGEGAATTVRIAPPAMRVSAYLYRSDSPQTAYRRVRLILAAFQG